MIRTFLITMLLALSSVMQAQTGPRMVDRYRTLYSGKNLVLTTTKGKRSSSLVVSKNAIVP